MSKTALLIDYEFCSGCHSCEIACRNELGLGLGQWGIKVLEDGPRENPDGSWHWDYIALPTELCNGCEERIARGEKPSCALNCQAHVIEYGDPKDLVEKMIAKGSRVVLWQP